jgi:hypothetical protein
MSEVTYESVLAQAQQLPWLDRQRLREQLAEEEAPPPKVSAKRVPWKDRSREYRWLREHAREYVGKWVALEGDQMVACGESALEVLEAAKAVGIDRPIVVQVEDPDGPPFAGF